MSANVFVIELALALQANERLSLNLLLKGYNILIRYLYNTNSTKNEKNKYRRRWRLIKWQEHNG